MSWRRCKLYSIYRFVKITEAGITIHTEFSKALLLVSIQSKQTTFWKSSLKECVTVFRHTIIWYKQGCQRVQLDFSWRYLLLISIELSFRLLLIFNLRYQFLTFFQAGFQADENPPAQTFPEQLSNLSYKLNLKCERLSYQIINTSAVNQAVFCYYQKFAKIIIEKKTLVLAVASNAEMHFFKFI